MLEICKNLNRKYISAEIDEKYFEMILKRLNNGKIDSEYKLKLKPKNKRNIKNAQPTLFEIK